MPARLSPGVGTYLYEAGARPHALTGIADGTAGAGVESGIMQEIGYTAFNLFHAHGKTGTPTGYTAKGYQKPNGAGLSWWIEHNGFPYVFRQKR